MATKHSWGANRSECWTFGAEFELDDWPRNETLPEGMALDFDWSLVNSNGVAVDGPGKLYHLGGEVLACPSAYPEGVADQLAAVVHKWPQVTVNHRTGVHIHIRVPGLRDDLNKLKQLQAFICEWMPKLLDKIEPIPVPTRQDYRQPEEFAGALKNYRKWKREHHFVVPKQRLEWQLAATSCQQFFEAEAIDIRTGKVHYAIRPRACLNLRQLLQTDTVEFRHFPGTTSPAAVLSAINWCRAFLMLAFDGATQGTEQAVQRLVQNYGPQGRMWPQFPKYQHWLEEGYLFTTAKRHPPDVVLQNIKTWLAKERPVQLSGE